MQSSCVSAAQMRNVIAWESVQCVTRVLHCHAFFSLRHSSSDPRLLESSIYVHSMGSLGSRIVALSPLGVPCLSAGHYRATHKPCAAEMPRLGACGLPDRARCPLRAFCLPASSSRLNSSSATSTRPTLRYAVFQNAEDTPKTPLPLISASVKKFPVVSADRAAPDRPIRTTLISHGERAFASLSLGEREAFASEWMLCMPGMQRQRSGCCCQMRLYVHRNHVAGVSRTLAMRACRLLSSRAPSGCAAFRPLVLLSLFTSLASASDLTHGGSSQA